EATEPRHIATQRRLPMTQQATSTATETAQRLRLAFDHGTILVEGLNDGDDLGLPGVTYDARVDAFRAEAIWYRAIVQHLRDRQIRYTDAARAYEPEKWSLRVTKDPFPHQTEGLKAWWAAGGRGVVVLPTGTGKTHLANLAIEQAGRPALIV